jgi:predicted nucleotidyltransferase
MAIIKAERKKLTPGEVKSAIAKFRKKLAKEEIPVKMVFLFGSYAKNRAHIDSDIDVAIILPSGLDYDREKIGEIFWWAKQINVKLEPHILSENDFNNRWFSLPAEIKKSGVEIK